MRWQLLLVLAMLAGLLLLVDRRSDPPEHQAQWLRADDVLVRSVEAGSQGPTVLMLHGYAESLMAFQPIFDQLGPDQKVMALDLPGFGLSDKPLGRYDLESYVRRLAAFLDAHVPGEVILVGHSMGGQIVAALALERPEQVKGLVLIASAGYGLSPTFTRLTQGASRMLGWFNAAVGVVVPLHDPEWLAEPADRLRYDPITDPRFRGASRAVLRDFDFAALKDTFGGIVQPTLIIWGIRDPTIPYSYGRAIAGLIPCSRFVTLDRTLHRPHQTQPDTVAFEIRRFLSDPLPCAPRDATRSKG